MALLASYRLRSFGAQGRSKFHVIGTSFPLGIGGSSWCARKSDGLGGQDFSHQSFQSAIDGQVPHPHFTAKKTKAQLGDGQTLSVFCLED